MSLKTGSRIPGLGTPMSRESKRCVKENSFVGRIRPIFADVSHQTIQLPPSPATQAMAMEQGRAAGLGRHTSRREVRGRFSVLLATRRPARNVRSSFMSWRFPASSDLLP